MKSLSDNLKVTIQEKKETQKKMPTWVSGQAVTTGFKNKINLQH